MTITVAGYFVPAVVSVAIVTFIVWALIGPEPRMALALINAVAVLIIACITLRRRKVPPPPRQDRPT